jgi:hypothetical protein
MIDEHRIDKVHVLDDTKIFRARGVLGTVRSDFLDYDNVIPEFTNPLPVINDLGDTIGYADLEFSEGKLIANITIAYSSFERLSIETDSEPMYLVPFGVLTVHPNNTYGELNMNGHKQSVNELIIYEVRITRRHVNPKMLKISDMELTNG